MKEKCCLQYLDMILLKLMLLYHANILNIVD